MLSSLFQVRTLFLPSSAFPLLFPSLPPPRFLFLYFFLFFSFSVFPLIICSFHISFPFFSVLVISPSPLLSFLFTIFFLSFNLSSSLPLSSFLSISHFCLPLVFRTISDVMHLHVTDYQIQISDEE